MAFSKTGKRRGGQVGAQREERPGFLQRRSEALLTRIELLGVGGLGDGSPAGQQLEPLALAPPLQGADEGSRRARIVGLFLLAFLAATAVGVAVGSPAPQAPRLVFRADHPFIF